MAAPAVKAVFDRALEIERPADREAYLAEACAGHPDVRQKVEGLLRAYADAGSFLEPAPVAAPVGETGTFGVSLAGPVTATFGPDGPAPTADYAGRDEKAGMVIGGKYTLVEPVGEGGMGSVWRAKQTEPVKRFVAVKLIKAGMDSKQVLARFEAERQALALMDHPNIARVLDGGLHDGRPFFVMELVKGVPITEYCDERKLTPKERLELFVPVCQAIQHAHQKGVIHRDIKPSNVLVALYDDRPVVKVIDFGVAKATGAALTERTIDTGFGGVVGTPQYMSPEQATLNNLDVDTRSDVYSLGVLLYELLTGTPPFSKHDLEKKGLLEVLRVVREEEPPRPSTKLSTADALPTLSANRGTEPKKLTGLLRNELDWIVMKALEKDRTRRYETATGFAADVERYLAGEPVVAHPPSAAYRLKKFVRRNKGQVIAASVVVLALLAGIVGTSWGLVQAKTQEAEARRQEGIAVASASSEKAANEQAQKRLKQIEKGNEIVTSIFKDLDIRKLKKGSDPLEAVLAKRLVTAAEQLEGESIGDPLAVAELQTRLARSLISLGYANEAIGLWEKAMKTFASLRGPEHFDTLTSMNNLGLAYFAAGKRDLALPLLEEGLRLSTKVLGAEHPDTLTSMNNLGKAYRQIGKRNLALPLLEEALRVRKNVRGAEHPDTLASMSSLGNAYSEAGKWDLALPLLEETLKLRTKVWGAEHRDTLEAMSSLAAAYGNAEKRDLALPLHEETLKLQKKVLGAEHPDTLASMSNLGIEYSGAGKWDLALTLLEESLRLSTKVLGAEHPDTLASMYQLGSGYRTAGKQDLALPLLEETLKLQKKVLGAEHPHTLRVMNDLVLPYGNAEKWDLAVPLAEETLKLRKKVLGAEHFETLTSMLNLAWAYRYAGKWDQALPLYEETLKLLKKVSGAEHPQTLSSMVNLVTAYAEVGRSAEAIALGKELLPLVRKTVPANSPRRAMNLAWIGSAFLQAKAFTEAEPILRECQALREKTEPDAWTTFNAQSLLGESLLGQKKYADAEPLLVKGYEGMKAREKTIPPQGSTRIPEALDRLIELHTATGMADEVKKWRAERATYPNVAPPPRATK